MLELFFNENVKSAASDERASTTHLVWTQLRLFGMRVKEKQLKSRQQLWELPRDR